MTPDHFPATLRSYDGSPSLDKTKQRIDPPQEEIHLRRVGEDVWYLTKACNPDRTGEKSIHREVLMVGEEKYILKLI